MSRTAVAACGDARLTPGHTRYAPTSNESDALPQRVIEAGAEEVFPLKMQFYGDDAGRVRDPFGHTWGFGQYVEDVSDEEMQCRMAVFSEEAGG